MARKNVERARQHEMPEKKQETLRDQHIDVAAEAEAMREAAPKVDWITQRAESYKENSVIERVGRDGKYEEWKVDFIVDDNLYVRHGDHLTVLTRTEAALEERTVAQPEAEGARSIAESIAEHWDGVIATTEGIGDKEATRAEKAFLDRYKKDIIRIAALSAAADDMPDMARLLYDAVAEIRKQDAEGIDDMYNRAIKANEERLRQEIHVDAVEEDEDTIPGYRLEEESEATPAKNIRRVIGAPNTEMDSVLHAVANRMAAAETVALTGGSEMVSVARGELSPFVALEIMKGFDIGQMTIEDLDTHIERCDDLIKKLKTNKDIFAAGFGILELQEREQMLQTSRSLRISEGAESAKAILEELAESAAGKDRPSKIESSLRRALEIGRIDEDEARDRLYELSKSPDLTQHEKDGVARLLDELKLPESEEITEQTIAPTPVMVEVETDEPTPKKASRARVIRPDDGSYRVGNKILSADDRPAAETPKWVKPKERLETYRAPKTVEPIYKEVLQSSSPDRTKVNIEGDNMAEEWMDVGDRGEALAAGNTKATRYTETFRRLADNFGGPKEFVRQYNELKTEFPKTIRFSLEDVKNAGIVERWWYKRKMMQAAEASHKRLEAERKAKLKRGKLQA